MDMDDTVFINAIAKEIPEIRNIKPMSIILGKIPSTRHEESMYTLAIKDPNITSYNSGYRASSSWEYINTSIQEVEK